MGFYGIFMVIQWDFIVIKWDINGIYPLLITNITMVERWPIEIDGLPCLKMGGFPWRSVK